MTLRLGRAVNGLGWSTIANSNIVIAMKSRYLVAVVTTLALSGCMTPRTSPPIEVAMIPNDCRNQEAIVNWLTQQAAIPQQPLESNESYHHHRRQIRAKIWHIRYECKPV